MKLRSIDFRKEQYWQPGHYGPSTKVLVNGHALPIGAGTSDGIDVFKGDDGYLYVLITNLRMGYVGLEIFDPEGEAVGDQFLQNDWEIEEILGPRGLDLAEHNMVRRMAQYIY
tara:strand:- start:234 stop:572 length:339 start_codon:yes stop_codon:yes gene_type:complete